jgi:hypothetical protein
VLRDFIRMTVFRFDGSGCRHVLAAYITKVERIVAADLRERSPACEGDDPFDRLG